MIIDWAFLLKTAIALFAIVNPIGSLPIFISATDGILLMLIAISMMHGKQSHTRQTPEEAETMAERHVIAIVPLSIPLLAGPGAISSMIITAEQSKSIWGHISLVIPIAAVSIIVWLLLNLAEGIARQLGVIGMNIITRLMGLVLAAMSVEFIAHGLVGLFPSLG